MGLDMYLFGVKKGYESYLKDNRGAATSVDASILPEEMAGISQLLFYFDTLPLPFILDVPGNPNSEEYLLTLYQWRKANAIHNWFVKNIQNGKDDCRWYKVSKKQLISLINTCKEVLDSSPKLSCALLTNSEEFLMNQSFADSSVAKKLLPTLRGPFYGTTDYNGYYIYDLKSTLTELSRIIETFDFEKYTMFYDSWS